MSAVPASQTAINQLCKQCGFCCNGVLFGDVELQKGDSAENLEAAGFELRQKGRKQCFDQPCSRLVKGVCTHYEIRPAMCRSFECRLLQRVSRGEVKVTVALRLIEKAKGVAEEIRTSLKALGNNDERLPLNKRYSKVLAEPWDFSASRAHLKEREQLSKKVFELSDTLSKHFLS